MSLISKSIKVDPELWQKARAKALSEGQTMQDLVDRLLREYLKEGGK